MQNLEIEVKFYLRDPKSVRQRIIDLNARCHGRFFLTKRFFDDTPN